MDLTSHSKQKSEKTAPNILIADDEDSMRLLLSFVFKNEGYQMHFAENGKKALEICEKFPIDVVIQDLKMPEMDGIELIKRLKQRHPKLPVIIITAFSNWENAVEAMRLGAFDYIKKPFDNDNIRAIVKKALQFSKHTAEFEEKFQIIGSSPAIRKVLEIAKTVAPTDTTVLIQGENGTGKDMIASALHANSLRADGPFIAVNCGAFASDNLLKSELFGHVRGAYTGAISDKKGYLELANKGTLFLDEIGEMNLTTQVLFLRVIEERSFLPLGGTTPKKTDVRFIAATNRNLEKEVHAGRFRQDLFYRLNVIPIYLPPLRERKEDIPLLVGHFLAKHCKKIGKPPMRISENALETLMNYHWPGNIRELDHVIQRAVLLNHGERIEKIHLSSSYQPKEKIQLPPSGIHLEKKLEEIEKQYIQAALETTHGHITKAGELLHLSLRQIRYKIQKYNLSIPLKNQKNENSSQ